MLAAGAALPVIVLTVFIVNLRHMLYSVSLIPVVQGLSQSGAGQWLLHLQMKRLLLFTTKCLYQARIKTCQFTTQI